MQNHGLYGCYYGCYFAYFWGLGRENGKENGPKGSRYTTIRELGPVIPSIVWYFGA